LSRRTQLAAGQGPDAQPLAQGSGLGQPQLRIQSAGPDHALQAHDDLTVQAAAVGFGLLLQPGINGIGQAFDRERRHRCSRMVPEWSLEAAARVKTATA
jgi:hypothetical protein